VRFIRSLFFAAWLILAFGACALAAPPLPTATPVPPTLTSTLSDTATFSPPTATASIVPSATVSPTLTPLPSATATITLTSLPTATPWPTVGFVGDQLARVDLPKTVTDAIGKTWLAFINVSDALPPGTPGTAVAASNKETVYLVSPDGNTRLKVIDLPSSTDRRVYWSPNGAYMAYFLAEGGAPGLYLLDLQNRATSRLFAMPDLVPRGFQIEPGWSPDSKQLTVALTTAYSVNLFSLSTDGTGFRNVSESESFDLWPVWSPDGAYLAFISDRAKCPSWTPNAAGSCYAPNALLPTGGSLYLMDATTHQIRLLADRLISSPPRWISPTRIGFTVSDVVSDTSATNAQSTADPSKSGSQLWWVDLRGGDAHQVTGLNSATAQALRESWSPDGHFVIYQEADASTRLVLRDESGTEIGHATQNFPRYSFAAAWSPDSKRVVIGGHNGQCPYGMLVADTTLKLLLNASPNPGMCDPIWSPDGKYIAFSGITASSGSGGARDGRFDLYVAETSGYGVRNLTGKLGGQIRFSGWIKGSS